MNGQIIRYLALNGPSLIYSIAKHLASISETKIHYPTVNRRIHDLLSRQYVQKAGKKATKAGALADLYATTLRGDFAALAGIPESNGQFKQDLPPNEIKRLVTNAGSKDGSPFTLIYHILNEGAAGAELADVELLPEIIKCTRDGYLNLDALNEDVICSSFASLVARRITAMRAHLAQDRSIDAKEKLQNYFDMMMRSLDKATALPEGEKEKGSGEYRFPSISRHWGSELKVFLKLPYPWFE